MAEEWKCNLEKRGGERGERRHVGEGRLNKTTGERGKKTGKKDRENTRHDSGGGKVFAIKESLRMGGGIMGEKGRKEKKILPTP